MGGVLANGFTVNVTELLVLLRSACDVGLAH